MTENEKAKFQTPFTYSDERNFVEHNPVKKISDDLVHPTKSHTSSISDSIFSEEREEITEDIPAQSQKTFLHQQTFLHLHLHPHWRQ